MTQLPNPQSQILTVSQAAKFLNVSIDTLRRWDKKGKLSPTRTAGGSRRYHLNQLEAFKFSGGTSPDLSRMLTIKEAAQKFGVSAITLRRWDKAGKIKFVRDESNYRRISISEIKKFLGEDEKALVVQGDQGDKGSRVDKGVVWQANQINVQIAKFALYAFAGIALIIFAVGIQLTSTPWGKSFLQGLKDEGRGTRAEGSEAKKTVLGDEKSDLSLSSLRVEAGPNLLKNSSFETNPAAAGPSAFWTFHPNSTNGNTQMSNHTSHSGSYSLLLSDKDCNGEVSQTSPSLRNCVLGVIQESTKTEAGRNYELGVWIKVNKGPALREQQGRALSDTRIHLALGPGWDKSFPIVSDGNWHWYSTSFGSPPPGLTPRIYVAVNSKQTTVNSETFLFLDDAVFAEINSLADNQDNQIRPGLLSEGQAFQTLIMSGGNVMSISAQGIIYPTDSTQTQGGLGLESSRIGKMWGSNIDISQSLSVNEKVDISGKLTANGNITLGNNDGDELEVGARFISDLLPKQSNAVSIGTSTQRWNNLFTATGNISNNLTVGGTTTITGLLTVNGGLSASGGSGLSVTGDLTLDGDLDFQGPQNITTTSDNLTISPTGNLVIDTSGGSVIVRDASIDLTGQPTTVSGSTLTLRSTGSFIIDTSTNNTDLRLQGGLGGFTGNYGTVSWTAGGDISDRVTGDNDYILRAGDAAAESTANNNDIFIAAEDAIVMKSSSFSQTTSGNTETIVSAGDYSVLVQGNNDLYLRGGGAGRDDATNGGDLQIAAQDSMILDAGDISLTASEDSTYPLTIRSASGGIQLSTQSSDNGNLTLYSAGSLTLDSSRNNTSIFLLPGTGRIGIGTTNPATAFHISASDGLIIPVGTTVQRAGTPTTGTIRYNSQTSQFEGYSDSSWGSLGGVIDVDQDTYVSAETSAGADNDDLKFTTAGTQRMMIDETGNIGIGPGPGSGTPSGLLDVVGNAPIILRAGQSSLDNSTSGSTSTTADMQLSAADQLLATAGSLTFLASNDSSYPLLLRSSQGGIQLSTQSRDNGNLTLYSAGTLTLDTSIYNAPIYLQGGLVRVGSGGTNTTATGDTDLYVQGDFEVDGNVSLGASTASTLSVGSYVVSNLIPDPGSTYDLGSNTRKWLNLYADTVTANNISGTVITGSTSAANWTIDVSNATADLEDSTVTFERGTEVTNSEIRWNSSGKRYFSSNAPFQISPDTGVGAPVRPEQAILTVNDSYGGRRLLTLREAGTDLLNVDSSGNIILSQASNIETSSGALTLRGYSGLTLTTSSASTGEIRVISRGTLQLDTSANNTNILVRAGTGNLNVSSTQLYLTGNLVVTGTETFNGVTYTFPGADGSASNVLTTSGTGLLSWGTLGASSITADSLDFSEFKDEMTLDADTTINGDQSLVIRTGLGARQNATSGSNDLQLSAEDQILIHGTALTLETSSTTAGQMLLRSDGSMTFDTSGGTGNFAFVGGNVGISQTSPTYKLDITGDIRSTTGAYFATSSGNVGVGTTSPTGILDVLGACLTKDAKIRRRRRRRRQDGGFDDDPASADGFGEAQWEDVPITDIKEGDEVMTLDEASGKLTVSTVKRLMNMGHKKVFRLTTADGKTIRTTAKHPYLVKNEIAASRLASGLAMTEGAKWIKVTDLKPGDKIAVVKKQSLGAFIDYANMKAWVKRQGKMINLAVLYQALKNSGVEKVSLYYGTDPKNPASFGFLQKLRQIGFEVISKPVKYQKVSLLSMLRRPVNWKMLLKLSAATRTALLQEAGKLEKKRVRFLSPKANFDVEMSLDMVAFADKFDGFVLFSGDGDFEATVKTLRAAGKKVIVVSHQKFLAGELNQQADRVLHFEDILKGMPSLTQKTPDEPGKNCELIVSPLSAFVNSGKPAFVSIASITEEEAEQVYDLEIEATHNFVANGIVAHNTSGILMRAGASSLQLSSSATSTTADIELAAADRIDLFAGSLSLQTSSQTAGELKLMSKGSLILDTSGAAGGGAPIALQAGSGNINLSSTGTITLTGNTSLNNGTLRLNGLTYTFPGADSANGVLLSNGSGLLSWTTLGAASITADSLDFTEFKDSMNLDADTSINGPYSFIIRAGQGSIENSTSGNNDLQLSAADKLILGAASFDLLTSSGGIDMISGSYMDLSSKGTLTLDTSQSNSHIVLTPGTGNIGIGSTAPIYKLDVNGTLRTTSTARIEGALTVTTGGASVTGDLTLNGDLDFTGPQNITTTSDDLTLSPTGNLIIDTSGGTVSIRDAAIDLTNQPTTISGSTLTLRATGNFILDTSANNTNIALQAGSGNINLSSTGTITLTGNTSLNNGTLRLNGLTYTFPGADSANGVLLSNGSGGLSWTTLGASSITADSLDFTEFKDEVTLDADTSINGDYSLIVRAGLGAIQNSTSGSNDLQLSAEDKLILAGASFDLSTSNGAVDIISNQRLDLSSGGTLTLDTSRNNSHIVLTPGTGNIGIGSTAPVYKLDVVGSLGVLGDFALNGDLDFTGPQNITTTSDDLTLSPTGNLIIDTSGGTLSIRDAGIDLTNQPTTVSGSTLSLRSTGTFIIDTSANNTNLRLQAGSGSINLSSGTTTISGNVNLNSGTLALNGITYTFPGADGSASNVLTTSGAGLLSWGTLWAASITNDSLDFAQFDDSLDLDADTSINGPYSFIIRAGNAARQNATSGSNDLQLSAEDALLLDSARFTLTTSSASGGDLRLVSAGTLQLDTSTNNTNILVRTGTGQFDLISNRAAINAISLAATNGGIDLSTSGVGGVGELRLRSGGSLKIDTSGNNNNILIDSGTGDLLTNVGTNTLSAVDDVVSAIGLSATRGGITLSSSSAGGNGDIRILSGGTLRLSTSANNSNILLQAGSGNINLSSTGTITLTGNTSLNNGTLKLNGLTYTFPGADSANGVLLSNGSGGLSWTTLGASSITADSLDFSEFKDEMTLDADTSINGDQSLIVRAGLGARQNATSGSNDLQLAAEDAMILDADDFTLTTSNTGVSSLQLISKGVLRLDTSTNNNNILLLPGTGNVGIGTTNPGALLDVRGSAIFNEDGADADFRVESDTAPSALFLDAGSNGGVGSLALMNTNAAVPTRFLVSIGGAGDTSWTSSATGTNPTAALQVRPGTITLADLVTGDISNILIGASTFTPDAGDTVSVGAGLYVQGMSKGVTGTITNMASVYIQDASSGGTNNYALWVDAGDARFDGNVGIGTTGPVGNLDVRGSGRVVFGSGNETGNNYFYIDMPARTATADAAFYRAYISNNAAITIPTGTSANVSSLDIEEPNITATGTVTRASTLRIGGAPTEATTNLALDVASGVSYFGGNVGIGTTGPGAKLDVSGAAPELRITATSASGVPDLGFYESSTLTGYLQYRNSGATSPNLFQIGTNPAGSQLALITSGTEWVRITSTGNVGIGTTGPTYHLDIRGGSAGGSVFRVEGNDQSNGSGSLLELNGNGLLGILSVKNYVGTYDVGLNIINDSTTTDRRFSWMIDADDSQKLKLTTDTVNSTTSLAGTSLVTIDTTGNVGIGTTGPGVKLDVIGNIRGSSYFKLADYDAGGASDTDLINRDGNWMFWNGGVAIGQYVDGLGSLGNGKLIVAGNVGIGTTSPLGILDVKGDSGILLKAGAAAISLSSGTTSSSDLQLAAADRIDLFAGSLSLQTSSTSAGDLKIISKGSLILDTSSSLGGSAPIIMNGNVGIGTTGPSGLLHVTGDSGILLRAGLAAISPSSGTGTSSDLQLAAADRIDLFAGSLSLQTSSTTAGDLKIISKGSLILDTSSSTGGSAPIILQGGNVGIGTTGPNAKLSFGSPANGTRSLAIWENSSAATGFMGFGNDANRMDVWVLGSTPKVTIQSDGNVGIGTTGPNRILHAYSSGNTVIKAESSSASEAGIDLYNSGQQTRLIVDSNVFRIWDQTDSVERLTIDTSGNVGIGTTGPLGILDVIGNSSVLLRAGQSSLQLSGSAASTTADIQLAAADRIDLFAGSLSLQTSSTTAGDLKIISKGSLILDTSSSLGGTAPIIMNGNVGIGTTGPGALLDVRGSAIFNEDATDADFRIESDTNANSFVMDAGVFSGVGRVSIGSTNEATTGWFYIDNPAITAGTNLGFYKTYISNNGAITIPAGTSANVSALNIEEPNITAVGTVTRASTLRVGGAPTEATTNLALDVVSGVSYFGGNVGIGTPSPAGILDVTGAGDISLRSTGDNDLILRAGDGARDSVVNNNDIQLAAEDSMILDAATFTLVTSSSTVGDLRLVSKGTLQLDTSSNNTPIVLLPGSNGVGIGTTGPGTILDIAAASPVVRVTGSSLGGAVRLVDSRAAGRDWSLQATETQYGATGIAGTFNIVDVTANSSRLTINSTGNVGIGTTGPLGKLDIQGDSGILLKAGAAAISLSSGTTSSSDLQLAAADRIDLFAGSLSLQTSSTSAGDLKIISKGSLILDTSSSLGGSAPIILQGGNVGIGSTAPAYKLDVAGDFRATTGAQFATTSGNVGIGTTSPVGKLHVTGAVAGKALVNLNETGDQAILTASASGVPRFTVGRSDITVNGQKDLITSGMTNVNDVFVYDTTKDGDGGKWRMDDRAKASSWYNEALDDGASDPCVNDTDDRCGRREFPEKAIIVATTTDLYIFDAKDNSQWMNFDQATDYIFYDIAKINSIFALNGKIYTAQIDGGLIEIDFIGDKSRQWHSSGLYSANNTIAQRNTAVTRTQISSSVQVVSSTATDVSAAVICGGGISDASAAEPAEPKGSDPFALAFGQRVNSGGSEFPFVTEQASVVSRTLGSGNSGTPYRGSISPLASTFGGDGLSTFIISPKVSSATPLLAYQSSTSSDNLSTNKKATSFEVALVDAVDSRSPDISTLTDHSDFVNSNGGDSGNRTPSSEGGRIDYQASSSTSQIESPTKNIVSLIKDFFSPKPAYAAAGPSCKTYVAVATDAGVSVINETDQKVINYTNTAGADAYSVQLTEDGTLYFSEAKNDELAVFTNIQNDTADQTSADRTYDETSGVALWSSAPSITGSASSLTVTQGTSTVDGNSNTIYLGHSAGMSRIDENRSDAPNGASKYYTNARITEEMAGDIRLMLPLNGTLSTSTAANTTIANADASVKLNPMTTSGAEGQPAYASGVRGTGLTFDGVNDYVCTGTTGTCADDTDFDFTGSFSMGLWINPGGGADLQALITKTSSYNLWRYNGGYAFTGYGATIGGYSGTKTVSFTDTQTSVWKFLVVTFDGSTLKIYKDGVLMNSASASNPSANDAALQIGMDSYDGGGSSNRFFTGTIDEPFVTAEALTPGQIKHMYEVGKRALQNHTASRIVGVTGADNYQRLMGNASGGTSTTNNVMATAVDDNNQFIYAGLNDTSAATGGVTVIGTNSDSAVDLYDATANTAKDDDAGTQFSASDVVAISVAGSPCHGYNGGSGACGGSGGGGGTLAIAGTNDTATRVWMETSDSSLYSSLALLSSSSLYKAGDITAGSALKVMSAVRLSLDTSTAEPEPVASFLVDQTGNLSVNSFSLDASGGTISIGQISSTPAASDVVGALNFTGRTLGAAGQRDVSYGAIRGIISSATDQSEAGILSFLTMRAGTLTEAARFDNSGNLGVGTTSPGGILDVLGQCVARGTLVPRRKRVKGKRQKVGTGTGPNPGSGLLPSSFDLLPYEFVPVEQIQAGDEVLTLDEQSGKFVWQKVNRLMDKGIKNTFKLTTEDGKQIRTTAEHPYLVRDLKNVTSNFMHDLTYETVENMGRRYYQKILQGRKVKVDAIGKNVSVHFTHEGFEHIVHEKKSKLNILSRILALPKVELLLGGSEEVTNYNKRKINGQDVEYWYMPGAVDGIKISVVVRSIENGPKHFYSVLWKGEAKSESSAGDVVSGISHPPRRVVTSQRQAHQQLYTTFIDEMSRAGVAAPKVLRKFFDQGWVKVRFLKPGMEIATVGDDGRVSWQRIKKIESVGTEQVYDIEVEGTHNFVAGHYVNRRTGKALTEEQEELYLAWQQKTTLADGSLTDSTVDTVAAELSVSRISQEKDLVKSGPEGNRTPANRIDSSTAVPTAGPRELLSQLKAAGVNPEDIYFGGIVAHNTSGILMRAGAASLQLSSSATSTTADIQLAAADRIDLFASSFSLSTSNPSAGDIKIDSAGTFTLSTSRNNANILLLPGTGNVGIGTTGPGTLLHINNPSDSDFFTISQGADYKHTFYNYFSGTDSRIDFKIASGVGTQANVMTLKGSGNVGIGTTGPNYLLGLYTATNPEIQLMDSTTGTTASDGTRVGLSSDNFFIWQQEAKDIYFGTSATERMRISSTGGLSFGDSTYTTTNPGAGSMIIQGNVGIGTTGPNYKLEVDGTSDFGDTASWNNGAAGIISWGTNLFVARGNSGYDFGLGAGGVNSHMIIKTDGNVGIGTTGPLGILDVLGSCVTGDTLLPIRRRRRKKKTIDDGEIEDGGRKLKIEDGENWDYLLCRIDQVLPGDEVMSLNEATGALEYSRINTLKDMGVKEVYELTTRSGRVIRTTAEHPYLVEMINDGGNI